MVHIKSIALIAVAAVTFSGCSSNGLVANNNFNKTKIGAMTGAVTGALVGYNTKGHDKGRRAAIGAVVGAAVGGGAGYAMDKQANQIASALGTHVDNDPLATLDPNRNIIVSKTDSYVKIMFRDNMMFATNSAQLQPAAAGKVNTVARLLQQYPQTTVSVAGFTDNSGSYQHNLQLSRSRAATVASRLGTSGSGQVSGCSYNKPIAPNDTASNKALNRRVEVYLYADPSKMINPCN